MVNIACRFYVACTKHTQLLPGHVVTSHAAVFLCAYYHLFVWSRSLATGYHVTCVSRRNSRLAFIGILG